MLIIGGVVLVIVLVVGGIFAYKKWDENRSNTNAKYTNCVAKATALEEKNEKIAEQVDAEIYECIKAVLVREGYTDEFLCMLEDDGSNYPVCEEEVYTRLKLKELGYTDEVRCVEDYTNPICTEKRYQAEIDAGNESIERTNVEINAYNGECGENRDQRLLDAGYDNTGIPAMDCIKYLGEK